MPTLYLIAVLFSLSLNPQKIDTIKITFNSEFKERNYAAVKDTAVVQFIPAVKNKTTLYSVHGVSVTFEGISGRKERIIQGPFSIPDAPPSRNPIIKIPLKNFIKANIESGIKVYIEIEKVERSKNGKNEKLNIPATQLNRTFTFSM